MKFTLAPLHMTRRALQVLAFTVVGLVAGIVVLVAVESALRLLGVGADRTRPDPFAGFSRTVPLFTRITGADGLPAYRTSPGRLLSAIGRADEEKPRQFAAAKPPGTFRAFILGDSSAAGVPYGTEYAFSAWLARRLAAALPGHPVEVVNAAVPGYASRRASIVNAEVLGYDPDLIIVYVGHNEYAERRYYRHLIDLDPRLFRLRELVAGTRLWGLLTDLRPSTTTPSDAAPRFEWDDTHADQREMFAVLDTRIRGQQYATPRERAYMEIMYRSNLTAIVRAARAAAVPVLLVTQSQNFADWAPGASAHRGDLTAADLKRWDDLVAAGSERAARGDCDAALVRYHAALAIDDSHAGLHYRVATCLRSLGRFPDARVHYRRASDLDQVPLGAPLRFNEIVREVAATEGALLADAEAALSQASQHGLVGDDLFCDWAHPNLRAQQIIAASVAAELLRAGLPAPSSEWQQTYADPDPEVLYAEDPRLRVAEWVEQMGMCALAQRAECALRSVDAVIAAEPDEPIWKAARIRILQAAAGWD